MKTWVVYIHKNKINGKVYIGQTCQDPLIRWGRNGEGYYNPKKGLKDQTHFYKAIQKYGWNNFEHGIIVEGIESLESANDLECYWIEQFDSINNGYNIASGGSSGNNFEGKTEEEMKEFSEKCSKRNKKRYESPKAREKASESAKKRFENMQEREKISKGRLNMSKEKKEEWKKKQSEAKKGNKNFMYGKTGINNPNYGRHHSEESKEKMSKAKSIPVVGVNKKTGHCIEFLGATVAMKEISINNFCDCHSAITRCCRGKIKSAYGYYWYYASDIYDLYFTPTEKEYTN